MIDKNVFFQEFTVRICSSLQINAALESVCEYLKQVIPLDVLLLIQRDETIGSMRLIAQAVADRTFTPQKIVAVPTSTWNKLQTYDRHIPHIGGDDELSLELNNLGKLQGFSRLIVPLWLDNELIGFLVMIVKGVNRYDQTHVDLFTATAHPAAIAMSNAMAHENLMRYSDTLIEENKFLNRELLDSSKITVVGGTEGLKNVIEMVRQVAPLNNTVLLLGETGTGKEVIANAIHFSSSRRDGPFIKVNCGAIPENLLDSELFGHEKGAFTGANSEKRGRFERANGGTIFLDEIGELPQQAQVRLLRVIQNREIERVGGTKSIPVDIRIIAATHRRLETMVSENRFREDLWYRLNVFPLMIPPLRQRKEDIPLLTNYFLELKSRELGLKKPPSIAPGVLSRLADYPWPGNVRELENLVERELIRHQGGPLTFDTLEPGKFIAATVSPKEAAASQLPTNLDEATANHIGRVLKMTDGKINGPSGAAVLLGIKANTLRARMDKLGICYGLKKLGSGGLADVR